MNNASTEAEIRTILTTRTSSEFYPPSAKWIQCKNLTYWPHSNECGPRTLLAATILALHPNPSQHILMPIMHQNLAQITRTWIGGQILQAHLDTDAIDSLLLLSQHQSQYDMSANSAPADLVQWNPISNMNEDVRKMQQHQTSSSNHFASSLNPLAPVFLPVKTTSSFDPGKSGTISTAKDTKHSTTTSNQKDTKGKVRKGLSKRQPIPFPGQNVMTKYLLPKKITTPPISQSMSLPTQENSSTSEEDVLSPAPEPETLQVASNKP
jgi:hypothetical protein